MNSQLYCDEQEIDLDKMPIKLFQFDDCASCKLLKASGMYPSPFPSPYHRLVKMRMNHLEREWVTHSSLHWVNPVAGYVLNYTNLLVEFKKHATSLKLDVDSNECEIIKDGLVIYPNSWTHMAPIIRPRIFFVKVLEGRNANLYDKVPLILLDAPIHFLNESLWKERWLEKKAKKSLEVADFFRPDFYRTLCAEQSSNVGWMLKKSNKKYITIPCVFNETLQGLEIMCFPYILFNSIGAAKDEAVEWFTANPDAGENFLAPIFELNTITGHVYLADQVNVVKDRPGKRKKDQSIEITKKMKDKMEEAIKNRFADMSIDDTPHPDRDMRDGCEKLYDRGQPSLKKIKTIEPNPFDNSLAHNPYNRDFAKLLQNSLYGKHMERIEEEQLKPQRLPDGGLYKL